jgi:hypothetical protein
MATATRNTVTVTIKHYSGGGLDPSGDNYRESLGKIEMDTVDWQQYADCTHPDYQWPQGIALAKDVLDPEDLGRLGIDGDMTIWLDD